MHWLSDLESYTELTYCGEWGQVQLVGEIHLQQQNYAVK